MEKEEKRKKKKEKEKEKDKEMPEISNFPTSSCLPITVYRCATVGNFAASCLLAFFEYCVLGSGERSRLGKRTKEDFFFSINFSFLWAGALFSGELLILFFQREACACKANIERQSHN